MDKSETGTGRRDALKAMGLLAVLAAAPRHALAQVAGSAAPGIQWNAAAFNAQTVDEALKALGAGTPAPTTEVSWGATPEIAENGAVVPVNVTSKIPGTEAIAILIEKNPNKLAANFAFPEGTAPALSTRVKMSESSIVYALVKTTDNKFFLATREIKVTLGGCGG
jgi:sulfur-oxidizing protein SoxY